MVRLTGAARHQGGLDEDQSAGARGASRAKWRGVFRSRANSKVGWRDFNDRQGGFAGPLSRGLALRRSAGNSSW